MERLARVSRELFFWYWDGTRGGIAQKRQCAWEFAVAVSGLAHDVASWDKLNKVLKDALTQGCPEGNCHVDTSRLREMTKFILAISRHSEDPDELSSSSANANLDSVFKIMVELSDSIKSKNATKSLCRMFGYRSTPCEHYLEEQYHRKIKKQAKLPDPVSFRNHLAADTCSDSEFVTVLNLLYDVNFQYSDMMTLDAKYHKDTARHMWAADGKKNAPSSLTSAQVKKKLNKAVSRLLKDYSNEPGGPKAERNVVKAIDWLSPFLLPWLL